MDHLYENLAKANLFKVRDAPEEKCKELNVTELWLSPSSGDGANHHRAMTSTSRAIQTSCLKEELAKHHSNGQSLAARFVWVEADVAKGAKVDSGQPRGALGKPNMGIDTKETSNESFSYANLSKEQREILLSSFGLKLAYGYCRTRVSGVTAYPEVAEQGLKRRSYSFSSLPKLAAMWSYTWSSSDPSRPPITLAIIFTQKSTDTKDGPKPEEMHQADVKKLLQKFLRAKWHPAVCQSAMFPALLIAIIQSEDVKFTKEGIRQRVKDLECQTGYHQFKSITRPDGTQTLDVRQLENHLKEANGYSSKLANAKKKTRSTSRLISFILERTDTEAETRESWKPQNDASVADAFRHLLRDHALTLQESVMDELDDIEYILARAQLQIQVLLELIARHANSVSHELSVMTTKLAQRSYEDSLSMKTLAVVTMLFLPGSFVSALFSTELFEWDKRDLGSQDLSVPPTPQFTLYWIITIPLTLLTFIVYALWLRVEKRHGPRTRPREEQKEIQVSSGTASKVKFTEMMEQKTIKARDLERGSEDSV